MLLPVSSSNLLIRGKTTMSRSYPFLQASVTPATASVLTNAQNKFQQSKQNIMFDENKERIKKMFNKVELSVSSYDTAWVAMIKSPSSPQAPLFPQSLNWLLENQQNDGSWALSDDNRHELLIKDSLLSTLACVLALKQWGVGEQQITKGLEYIESNIGSAYDDKQYSPIGFDIIFSHLFEQVQKLDLNLPLGGKHLESLIHKRELELKRGWAGSNAEGWKAYLTYISEGLGRSQDWEMAMKYQRKNGSLFNSPAATATAFTHLNNTECFDYLLSLVDKFGNAVPTLDPFDVYARIYMVDNLKKLGIDRHFKEEIQTVLDQTYRSWQQEEEDIFLEPTTCAMAFRLLRLHGYDISSDSLSRFSKDKFCNTLQGYLKDVDAVLELHKASQIVLHSNNDSVLHELYSWTRSFLDEYLSSPLNHISHEVRFAVRDPHTYLDCVLNQRSIEHYKVDQKRTLKTSYSCSNLSNKEFLELAVEDLNLGQLVFREEFKQYQRWFKESGMDKLEFPRAKVAYCYIAAIVGNDSPELSEARLSWAKNGVILSIIDDLFDVWGTEEEQINLVKLLEKWDVDVRKECCSERVRILFAALKGIICEVEEQAFKIQGRSVLSHVVQIWVDLLRSFTKEAEWEKTKCVPRLDEYLPNSIISFAVGVLIPGLYLVGPKLPNEIIQSDEFNQLYETLSLFGRLLNDINGYQREKEQGKLINSITVELMHGSGGMSEVAIIEKLQRTADEKRKEVLRLVVKQEGSIVPRDVKDLFWNWCKLFQLFYKKDDVLHANDLADEFMISFKHVLGHL